jgi:hypothetical protein
MFFGRNDGLISHYGISVLHITTVIFHLSYLIICEINHAIARGDILFTSNESSGRKEKPMDGMSSLQTVNHGAKMGYLRMEYAVYKR